MKALVQVILVSSISLLITPPIFANHHYDKCDQKIDFEKGEKAGGPFFGLGLLMSMHFLAENYCGYKLPPLKPVLENLFNSHGCEQGSELFDTIMENESKMRSMTLVEFALQGQIDSTFTESDARKAYKSTIKEVGGCKSLGEMMREETRKPSK